MAAKLAAGQARRANPRAAGAGGRRSRVGAILPACGGAGALRAARVGGTILRGRPRARRRRRPQQVGGRRASRAKRGRVKVGAGVRRRQRRQRRQRRPRPPPKPKQHSAYTLYVLEQKDAVQAAHPAAGWYAVQTLIGDAWRKLPDDEKAQYAARARALRSRRRPSARGGGGVCRRADRRVARRRRPRAVPRPVGGLRRCRRHVGGEGGARGDRRPRGVAQSEQAARRREPEQARRRLVARRPPRRGARRRLWTAGRVTNFDQFVGKHTIQYAPPLCCTSTSRSPRALAPRPAAPPAPPAEVVAEFDGVALHLERAQLDGYMGVERIGASWARPVARTSALRHGGRGGAYARYAATPRPLRARRPRGVRRRAHRRAQSDGLPGREQGVQRFSPMDRNLRCDLCEAVPRHVRHGGRGGRARTRATCRRRACRVEAEAMEEATTRPAALGRAEPSRPPR